MKYIKLFESFVSEAVTDIVYHFTFPAAFRKIVKDDTFFATLALGTSSDARINRGKSYFFSTTRSKSQGYQGGPIKFVLDGRKLNQKYKSAPVDYWQRSMDPNDYADMNQFRDMHKDEMEDRLMLDKPEIKPAGKYVSEVHMKMDLKYESDFDTDEIEMILNWSKKYNIPIWVYDSSEDWQKAEKNFMMQRNGVKLSAEMLKPASDLDIEMRQLQNDNAFSTTIIAKIIAILEPDDEKAREKLIDLTNARDYNEGRLVARLKKEIDEILRGSVRSRLGVTRSHTNELAMGLKSDMHNNRSSSSKVYREFFKLLTKDMRKYKETKLEDYLAKKLGAE